jgi:uncharacterized protein YukE
MLDPGDGIRFDFAVAHDAAQQLRATAVAIEAAIGRVYADLPLVTEDWHGRSRAAFDATIIPCQIEGKAIAHTLRLAARDVEARAILARTAMRSRVPR